MTKLLVATGKNHRFGSVELVEVINLDKSNPNITCQNLPNYPLKVKIRPTSLTVLIRYPESVFLVMLGTSSFPARPRNEVLGCFPIDLVPTWERPRTQHD
jgi:hypothetical protein